MGKIRVYQVAKELGIDNREMISRILSMGIDVRNYMSTLESEDIARVKRAFEKQRHEEMVEEQIRPGVTRRRSLKPRRPVQKPAATTSNETAAAAVQPARAPKRRAPTRPARPGPAVPPPPESAVLPSARPKALENPAQQAEVSAVAPPDAQPAEQQPPTPAPPPPKPKKQPQQPKADTAEPAQADPATKETEPPAQPQKSESNPAEAQTAEPHAEAVKPPPPPKPKPPKAAITPPAPPEPPKAREVEASKEPTSAPPPPDPPRRPEPPQSAPPRPSPPGAPARPTPPKPPARPEPPVSKRASSPAIDPSRFVDLPPRPVPGPKQVVDPFQLGPPGQGKGKRGRRREVQGRELRNRSDRSSGRVRPGRKKKVAPGRKVRQTEITVPKDIKRVIRIESTITLQELAKRMGIKATEVLVKLMEMGVGSIHINSMLDAEMAKIIADEFNYQVEDVAMSEEDLLKAAQAIKQVDEQVSQNLRPRPPVVTMLGHVDHGKTSLLDKIRLAKVAQGEAGGITQHIGAYQVETKKGAVTFIDTPGHEAFTAMRARGAQATDISVLVVAADDGVMPTTKEAIAHARAAKTPIVVALNKIDLEDANPDLALRGLSEEGLQPEEWGGDTVVCRVSAKTGEGLDQLLEMIVLTSEMMEIKADPDGPGAGVVLEAKLEKGRGPVATVLVQDGKLRVGDYVVAGSEHGKVRALGDALRRKLKEAGPSTPVEILGLSGVPGAGDHVDVVADSRKGDQLAGLRAKAVSAAAMPPSAAMTDIMERLRVQQGEDIVAKVNLIIKGDVQGSVEAIRDKITGLSTPEVEVKIMHSGVGGVTETDVNLAATSEPNATIIGFGVRAAGKARVLSERERVDIRYHTIIYELLDDIKAIMVGRLRPTIKEIHLGQAEVRQTFHIPKVGTVAGCHVSEGKIQRNAHARLVRDSVEVWKGHLASLRRHKDDAKEVASGYECGIGLEGYQDVKVGDVIEAFMTEEVAPTL